MAFILRPIPTVKNVISKKARATASLDPGFIPNDPIDNDPNWETDLFEDNEPISPFSPQGEEYSQSVEILHKQFRGQRYV